MTPLIELIHFHEDERRRYDHAARMFDNDGEGFEGWAELNRHRSRMAVETAEHLRTLRTLTEGPALVTVTPLEVK